MTNSDHAPRMREDMTLEYGETVNKLSVSMILVYFDSVVAEPMNLHDL